jgi:hypothetical protein
MLAWAIENNGVVPVQVVGRAYIGQDLDARLGKGTEASKKG